MPESLTFPLLSLPPYPRTTFSAGGWAVERNRGKGACLRALSGCHLPVHSQARSQVHLPVHRPRLGVRFTWGFPDCSLESDQA